MCSGHLPAPHTRCEQSINDWGSSGLVIPAGMEHSFTGTAASSPMSGLRGRWAQARTVMQLNPRHSEYMQEEETIRDPQAGLWRRCV